MAQFSAKIKIDQEALERIDALTATLEKSLSDFNNAMPGGQYMLLIQDLNSGIPERVAAAQAFLRSLGDLDPETNQYDVSTWFEFDSSKPLRAMTFRAETPSPKEIETRYAQGYLLNPDNVSSTPLRGPTPAEVDADLRARLTRVLGNIVGGVGINSYMGNVIDTHGGLTGYKAGPLTYIGGHNPNEIEAAHGRAVAEVRVKHDKLFASTIDDLVGAFGAFYQNRVLPLPPLPLVQQWNLFDDRQVLFIVIPEEDWVAHEERITAKALIHERGNPNSPLPGTQLQNVLPDEWQVISLSDAQRPPRTYRWTFRTMTDLRLLSSTTVSRIREAQKALAEWKSLTQPAQSKKKKR